MGSLKGHLVPGTYFIVCAIWWTYNIFKRYFTAHFQHPNQEFRSAISFSCQSRCQKRGALPLEVILKVFALIAAILGEYITALDDNWTLSHTGNLQHIMMYAFFAIHPIFEILYHYQFKALPKDLDYLTAILAFAVEAFLFKEHLHGRAHMDIQLHTYQVYAIGLCCLASLLEWMHINDARPALARATFTLLQGTWFYQIGFVLYPPESMEKWNVDDHSQMMIITVFFTLHLASIILFQGLVGFLVYRSLSGHKSFSKINLDDYDSDTTSDDRQILLRKNGSINVA